MVASGLDAGFNDPSARMLLHSDSFRRMTAHTMELASALCKGNLVFSHEGAMSRRLHHSWHWRYLKSYRV